MGYAKNLYCFCIFLYSEIGDIVLNNQVSYAKLRHHTIPNQLMAVRKALKLQNFLPNAVYQCCCCFWLTKLVGNVTANSSQIFNRYRS